MKWLAGAWLIKKLFFSEDGGGGGGGGGYYHTSPTDDSYGAIILALLFLLYAGFFAWAMTVETLIVVRRLYQYATKDYWDVGFPTNVKGIDRLWFLTNVTRINLYCINVREERQAIIRKAKEAEYGRKLDRVQREHDERVMRQYRQDLIDAGADLSPDKTNSLNEVML